MPPKTAKSPSKKPKPTAADANAGEAVNLCARKLLDTIPLVMRTLRAEIRRCRFPELSIPQFRAMSFIGRNPGANLCDLADHLGLTPPAVSRLVDGLVAADCVVRGADAHDRRKLLLDLTRYGGKRHAAARDSARHFLAGRLGTLASRQVLSLSDALDNLAGLFQGADGAAARPRQLASPRQRILKQTPKQTLKQTPNPAQKRRSPNRDS